MCLKIIVPASYPIFVSLFLSLSHLTIWWTSLGKHFPDLHSHSILYFSTSGYLIPAFTSLLSSAHASFHILWATYPKILDIPSAKARYWRTSLDYSGHISTALYDHEPEQLAWLKIQFGDIPFFHHLAQCLEQFTPVKVYSKQKNGLSKPALFSGISTTLLIYTLTRPNYNCTNFD